MESKSLLAHLWPNFAANLTGDPEGISVIFWVWMTLVLALASGFVLWHLLQCRARIKAVRSLLKGQTKETLAQNRRALLKRAGEISVGDVGSLWREFDESLVISADNSQLYNTLDAEHFFNSRTLARGLTASRLLTATPSFLVAIGVLGTFVGLTIGLVSLNVSSNEVETLKQGIDKMIQGASVAFLTSVWGVFYSLLLNLWEKVAERHALAEIGELQHEIDFLYPRIPAEQSLVHIADHTRESKTALQELHERIGDRLQESMQGISEGLQRAMTEALERILGPAIIDAQDRSTKALEEMLGAFIDRFESSGKNQANQMASAAQNIRDAVAGLGAAITNLKKQAEESQDKQRKESDERERNLANMFEELIKNSFTTIASAVQNMLDQSGQLVRQHEGLMQRLQTVSDAVAQSSRNLDSSSNHLGLLAENTRQASETLGQRLLEVAGQIHASADLVKEATSQLIAQGKGLADLQTTMLEGATLSKEAAILARDSFGSMKQHQEDFLSGVGEEFTRLGALLKDQVTAIENQARQWLEAYSTAVNDQVQDRMEKWNSVSQQYADQMLNTVNAISSIVDELEVRR
jgi:hypothetical protein